MMCCHFHLYSLDGQPFGIKNPSLDAWVAHSSGLCNTVIFYYNKDES
jgi:hypothetical protein